MRLALVVFASSLVACTADFSQFEPGGKDDALVLEDSSAETSELSDSEAPDSEAAA